MILVLFIIVILSLRPSLKCTRRFQKETERFK
jgi:hypothetical protein